MKRILRYHKNRKGMTIVLVALMLVVLLMFLGMAVDIAYMYFVKNQLQVAADASALGGAPLLTGASDSGGNYEQLPARKAAWKFACKNKAASAPVYLVTNTSTNCDAPPETGLNESANTSTDDIVVGNWNNVTSTFTPATGSTGLAINALKTRPRRTNETPGMPQVGVFVGQIFRMIGTNWSLMSASASAIATMPPKATGFIAMGSTACPSVGSAECALGTGSTYPTVCELTTPRVLIADAQNCNTSDISACPNRFGWTSLLLAPGSSSGPAFREGLLCGNKPAEEVCGTSGIYGISGAGNSDLQNYESVMFDPTFDTSNKRCGPTAELTCSSTDTVTGWWVIVPQNIIPQPMFQSDPHPVTGYIKIRIRAICAPGGGNPCRPFSAPAALCNTFNFSPGNSGIVIDRISCISCDTVAGGLAPALVK